MGSNSPSQLLLPWISRHRAVSSPSDRPDFSAREARSMSPTSLACGSVVAAEVTTCLLFLLLVLVAMRHRRTGGCWKSSVVGRRRLRAAGRLLVVVVQEEMVSIGDCQLMLLYCILLCSSSLLFVG
jgi:hypothetical protein